MVFEGDLLKDYRLDFKDNKLVKVELPNVEENTVSEETYTQEHFARKEAEQKLWVLQQNAGDDCVSRQAVTDAVENTIAKYIPTFIGQYEKIPLELARAIKDVSPVVPTLKVGKWIYNRNIQNWECSECGEPPKTLGYVGTAAFMTEHFKFCNHCGAEMKGVEK